MDIEDIEAVRLQSQLSERLHYVETNKKRYMCITGIAMPYRVGVILMLWAMSNIGTYRIKLDDDIIDPIKQLNPDNETLNNNNLQNGYKIPYLIDIFRKYLAEAKKIDSLEDMIPIDISILNSRIN